MPPEADIPPYGPDFHRLPPLGQLDHHYYGDDLHRFDGPFEPMYDHAHAHPLPEEPLMHDATPYWHHADPSHEYADFFHHIFTH